MNEKCAFNQKEIEEKKNLELSRLGNLSKIKRVEINNKNRSTHHAKDYC